MAEAICNLLVCNLLDLNLTAGLGRRLADADIKQDVQNSNLFYIFPKDDVVEAATLAHALSIQAKEVRHLQLCFVPIRTSASHQRISH
jgi:hypothetical protein